MKKIRLFVNNNERSLEVAKNIQEKLEKKNFQIVDEDYEIAIAIGGDGSFLRMVKEANFNDKCIYVGINAGTLGFAQEINLDEINEFVKVLERDEYKIEEIGIAEIEIITPDSCSKQLALNELVVRDLDLNTTNIKIEVENNLLENYVGDGILISTSFGSTAYNLSFGGSIVYNTFLHMTASIRAAPEQLRHRPNRHQCESVGFTSSPRRNPQQCSPERAS